MKSLNEAKLIGNLGQDPELKYTPNGDAVLRLSLCTNEKFTAKNGDKVERACWHRLVFFGKLAEIAAKYLSKGDPAFISGRIQNGSYEDAEGRTVYTSDVIVREMIMLGGKRDDQPARDIPPSPKPQQDPNEITDADIPF